jgi:pyruvate dehydrogenase E2 component (dihydrolipoamide acetyltransferase)
MASEIKLPALKENVDVVEVNAVRVAAGDAVTKDQVLLEVQADKTALDVPSPEAGRITEIRVKVGEQIKIGQVIALIEAGGNGQKTHAKVEAPTAKAPQQSPARKEQPAPAKSAPTAPLPAPTATAPAVDGGAVVHAGPAARRLARELGVDLRRVTGSARHGRVVEDDVKSFVREIAAGAVPVAAVGQAVAPPLPNFESFGPVQREDLSRVRRLTAKQMSLAWSLVPHVTQHDSADITDLEAFRKQQAGRGPKLTVTAFALKACAIALKEYPQFNSSLDAANSQLILKRYYHIGVAVDTDAGLLVPVIRDVDKKSVAELAEELNATAEKARQGKADMGGGTFTITNLGGIAGTGFTPIVNWPEVAILGLSRSRLEPVVRDGAVTPRLMLPLSLSYDHRVIDGAAAARFTRRLAELLENPLIMVLHA